MPDESGKLTSADIPIARALKASASLDNCLSCPVTGRRVPISQWQISDRLSMLPTSGPHFKANLAEPAPVLTCRSPAGSLVFLDALHVGLLVRAVAY